MNELVRPLSLTLVHFLWQGLAIALALALVLRGIRATNANLRYAAGVSALCLMVLMPIATLVYTFDGAGATPETRVTSRIERPSTARVVSKDTAPGAAATDAATLLPSHVGSLPRGIVALWLTGVLAFTVLNTGGWLSVCRLRRSGSRVEDPSWDPWIDELRDRLGLTRAVAVLSSTRVDVPTVVGWIRPVVLVPASALLGMCPRSLEALLLHELAHVRRHDFLVNLLQAALETLLFYHPAVWWVSRRVRGERENCCDDLAVRLCGSRVNYVQALADMERLRLTTPRMAVAADGGSLMDRIRRLTGATLEQNSKGSRWAMGVGLLALALTLGAVQLASVPPASAAGESSGDVIEGTWQATERRGTVHFRLNLDGRRNHTNGFSIPHSYLTGTGEDGIPGFQLVRDAGTFFFEGRLDGSDRESPFEFRTDPSYATKMRSIGFDAPTSARRLYMLAAVNVSLEFAEGIRDAGYGDISMDRLTEFRIHGVTAEFVKDMAAAGFGELSPNRLVEFRIHGVSPDFVRDMADIGLDGLSASRLVEFRIHGVSSEFVRAMKDAEVDDLSPSRLVEFRIHGVNASFVEKLAQLGLRDLSASRLISMRIHGVSPEFVEKAQAKYGDDLTADDLIDMRIHGERLR